MVTNSTVITFFVQIVLKHVHVTYDDHSGPNSLSNSSNTVSYVLVTKEKSIQVFRVTSTLRDLYV